MADLAIYALVGTISHLQERLAIYRSPIIPLDLDSFHPAPPPVIPTTTTISTRGISRSADAQFLHGTLTEYGLELVHHSWATRHAALSLRLMAMRDAVAKNLIGCWAGLVQGPRGRENLRAVRLAVEEAAWVEQRLRTALEWCRERNLKRMKLSSIVQPRRGKHGPVVRPTHTDIPPTLLDLPFPLPLAPPSSRLTPSVPRPPPLRDSPDDTSPETAAERNGPPTYTREADPALGESTLEGGFWAGQLELRQYEAASLEEDDDVREMLRLQHPRTS